MEKEINGVTHWIPESEQKHIDEFNKGLNKELNEAFKLLLQQFLMRGEFNIKIKPTENPTDTKS
jgi:hypothetical protein